MVAWCYGVVCAVASAVKLTTEPWTSPANEGWEFTGTLDGNPGKPRHSDLTFSIEGALELEHGRQVARPFVRQGRSVVCYLKFVPDRDDMV
jgi:hypothetical protein